MPKHFLQISVLNSLFIFVISALSAEMLSARPKNVFARYAAARTSSSGSLASLEPNQLPFQ